MLRMNLNDFIKYKLPRMFRCCIINGLRLKQNSSSFLKVKATNKPLVIPLSDAMLQTQVKFKEIENTGVRVFESHGGFVMPNSSII